MSVVLRVELVCSKACVCSGGACGCTGSGEVWERWGVALCSVGGCVSARTRLCGASRASEGEECVFLPVPHKVAWDAWRANQPSFPTSYHSVHGYSVQRNCLDSFYQPVATSGHAGGREQREEQGNCRWQETGHKGPMFCAPRSPLVHIRVWKHTLSHSFWTCAIFCIHSPLSTFWSSGDGREGERGEVGREEA